MSCKHAFLLWMMLVFRQWIRQTMHTHWACGNKVGGLPKPCSQFVECRVPCSPPQVPKMHPFWNRNGSSAWNHQAPPSWISKGAAPTAVQMILKCCSLKMISPLLFFSPLLVPIQGDGHFAASNLAREHARLHIKTLVFVHVFSGFRRGKWSAPIVGTSDMGCPPFFRDLHRHVHAKDRRQPCLVQSLSILDAPNCDGTGGVEWGADRHVKPSPPPDWLKGVLPRCDPAICPYRFPEPQTAPVATMPYRL